MNRHDDFERSLATWLEEVGTARPLGYLDEAFERTRHVRQRPAWSSPGRWLPMQLTFARSYLGRLVPILALVALLAVALVAAAVLIGSPRRLPPPFGLAATGQLAFDSVGDIYVASADGTGRRVLVGGAGDQFGATWSLDGTKVAYWQRSAGTQVELWVVNADGSGARSLTPGIGLSVDTAGPAVSWSPDGGTVAFATILGELYVVAADGSGLRQVGDGSLKRYDPAWSPPDGSAIAFRGEPNGLDGVAGVYVVRPDGQGEERVSETPAGPGVERLPRWSPDGTRIAYHINIRDGADLFIARRSTSGWTETRIDPETYEDLVAVDSWPEWSNDGSRLSWVRSLTNNHGYLMVASADGANPRKLESGLIGWSPHCWTPDDRSIVAVAAESETEMGKEVRPGFVLLTVDGTRTPIDLPTPGRQSFYACSSQRLAP